MASSSLCRRLANLSLHYTNPSTKLVVSPLFQQLNHNRFSTIRSISYPLSSTIPSDNNNGGSWPRNNKCRSFVSSVSHPILIHSLKIRNDLNYNLPTESRFSTSTNTDSSSTDSVYGKDGQLLESEDGRQFAAFAISNEKLKPYIVKRRLGRMKTYIGAEKNIRHSPWRLNLVCQLAAGLPLQEALNQLEFCKKSKAPLVQKVLQRTANLADIRDGLQISQLEVAECFATKGTPLKRLKTMGRGRSGEKRREHSHFRVVLREIDFKLRIYQASTINQKKKWFLLQQQAESDAAQVKIERDEIKKLEKQASDIAATKKKT